MYKVADLNYKLRSQRVKQYMVLQGVFTCCSASHIIHAFFVFHGQQSV